jgi:hypothetical protein
VTDIAARMCACADQIQAEHAPEYLLRAGAATIAELRAEVERLQAIAWRAEDRANTATDVSKLAADLLEIAEIKDEIVEACARWQLRSLDVDTRPLRITTEHLIDSKAFGNKCFDATLTDWRAARDWLRGVTAKKAPEPPAERLSEPISTMDAERCAEVAEEVGLARGVMREANSDAWVSVWMDRDGAMKFCREHRHEENAARCSLRHAARENGKDRRDDYGRERVVLPPLSKEATD